MSRLDDLPNFGFIRKYLDILVDRFVYGRSSTQRESEPKRPDTGSRINTSGKDDSLGKSPRKGDKPRESQFPNAIEFCDSEGNRWSGPESALRELSAAWLLGRRLRIAEQTVDRLLGMVERLVELGIWAFKVAAAIAVYLLLQNVDLEVLKTILRF